MIISLDSEVPKRRRSNGGKQSKRALQNWRTDSQLPLKLFSICQANSYPTNLPYTHQLFLVFLKQPRKPYFDRGGGHLQKLKSQKFQIQRIYERCFLKRVLPVPVLLLCHRRPWLDPDSLPYRRSIQSSFFVAKGMSEII